MKRPRLVLYSGGQQPENSELHRRLVALASSMKRSSKHLTMTYVPFCTDGSGEYFKRAIRRYRAYGVVDFLCLDLERNPTRSEIREALRSQIVYLPGGNTFSFLYQLRRLKMMSALKTFVERGGVLAGLSAGALIMTPTIKLAGVPGLEPDENEVGLKDLSGLKLVPFEFSPHFEPTRRRIEKHLAYSRRNPNPVYASQDGGGIIIEGRQISLIGPTWIFHQGRMLRVN